MSVGFFMGIRPSYMDEARATADAYIAAINKALASAGLGGYVDPETPPNVYDGSRFGRSSLDHHSARCLAALGELALAKGIDGQISVLAANPYRIAFVPVDFPTPLATGHSEGIGGQPTAIPVGSSHALLREVLRLAPHLGITLRGGALDDSLATRIDDMEPLSPDDDGSQSDDERTAWLLLHEGARLSVSYGVALSLAG
jgi:hypothetical protein